MNGIQNRAFTEHGGLGEAVVFYAPSSQPVLFATCQICDQEMLCQMEADIQDKSWGYADTNIRKKLRKNMRSQTLAFLCLLPNQISIPVNNMMMRSAYTRDVVRIFGTLDAASSQSPLSEMMSKPLITISTNSSIKAIPLPVFLVLTSRNNHRIRVFKKQECSAMQYVHAAPNTNSQPFTCTNAVYLITIDVKSLLPMTPA